KQKLLQIILAQVSSDWVVSILSLGLISISLSCMKISINVSSSSSLTVILLCLGVLHSLISVFRVLISFLSFSISSFSDRIMPHWSRSFSLSIKFSTFSIYPSYFFLSSQI